jgi:type IVB pilus formation R64 PilN family outer membrane protein
VEVTSEPYLMGTVVKVHTSVPSILKQRIHIGHYKAMTLNAMAALITKSTGIPVHVDMENIQSDKHKSGMTLPPLPGQTGTLSSGEGSRDDEAFHWSGGNIAQLLSTVTAAHRVYWKWDDGAVRIFRTETQTFNIPALDWVGNLKGSISSSSGSSASSMSGTTGTPTSTGTGNMNIDNASTVNVWKGLTKVVKTIAGANAQVIADPSLGTVSVTATPSQLERVARWIKTISRQLTQQVAVTIHVYNVRINAEQNYGLNLSGAFNQIANRYGMSFSGAGAPPIQTSGVAPLSFGASILQATNPANAQYNGSSVTAQALATLGNTTQMYSQSAVTLNGQPSPVQVARNITYLASSTSMQTLSVGSSTSLTPGSLTTGFTANILPRIEGNYILLGINMNLSDLIAMNTITSNGSSIQAPSVYTDSFFKSVDLKSGETLVLNSYAKTQGKTTNNGVGSPYLPILGGGADAAHDKTMVVITITARII